MDHLEVSVEEKVEMKIEDREIAVDVTLEGTEAPPLDKEDSDNEAEESDNELLPEPVPKSKLKNDEVFAPQIAQVKKPRKKRKPMTESQLQKLAEARTKAFATKARKKQERDELKALEQEAETTTRQRKIKKLKAVLDDDDDETKTEVKESFKAEREYKETKLQKDYEKQKPTLTQEDLRKATEDAIEAYDTKRKAQKKVKKEKQAKQQQEDMVLNKINKAINPDTNPWDQLFS